MALPMFDDEEIVKDPIHIGQVKGRGVAGLHPMACQAVVIADIANGPSRQGQVCRIGLVMLFQIGFEIRFSRSFTSFSINLQLALFYAYPMVGHEADDGITPQVVGQRRIEENGISFIGKEGEELAGRIGKGGNGR